jgi:glycopeptide antibiotics resistance protein
LNIAGFIPLGFFFTVYFSLVRPIPRPRIMVVVLGLTISLTIETAQYFLPTRDSSMTDVITNTLGTAIGVAFYQPILIREFLTLPYIAGLSQRLQNSRFLRSGPA